MSIEKPQPVVFGEIHRPQAEIDNEEGRESHNEKRDRARLVVEVLGLGVAYVIAVAAIHQLTLTRDAVKIAAVSAKASERSASASEAQANAARSAIESTIEQYRLDERAWVTAPGITDLVISTEQTSGFTVIITNSGKTSARHMHNNATGKSIPQGQPVTFTYDRAVGPHSSGLSQREC
jgi:hypothetical protein